MKNTADKLKRNVFELYGGVKCACCGETNIKFLTLDHKHNDGKEHRQSVGKGKSMYSWALKNYSPDIFQVLCYNCNYGKAKNGGICPHENS